MMSVESGLTYTIGKLGIALAEAEQHINQLTSENEALRGALALIEQPAKQADVV